jgi:hypothetical protein
MPGVLQVDPAIQEALRPDLGLADKLRPALDRYKAAFTFTRVGAYSAVTTSSSSSSSLFRPRVQLIVLPSPPGHLIVIHPPTHLLLLLLLLLIARVCT